MRVLIVDDHLMLAQAVGGLISQLCMLELQGVCGSAAQAMALIKADCPDLLILDLVLPGEDWELVAKEYLRRCNVSGLILLSGMAETIALPDWCQQAACAVIDKCQPWSVLLTAVQQWIRSAEHGYKSSAAMPLQGLGRLSPREMRLFAFLGQGMLNREIAQQLELSLATVESYRKNICAKLGISGSELVRQAVLHRCLPTATPASLLPASEG